MDRARQRSAASSTPEALSTASSAWARPAPPVVRLRHARRRGGAESPPRAPRRPGPRRAPRDRGPPPRSGRPPPPPPGPGGRAPSPPSGLRRASLRASSSWAIARRPSPASHCLSALSRIRRRRSSTSAGGVSRTARSASSTAAAVAPLARTLSAAASTTAATCLSGSGVASARCRACSSRSATRPRETGVQRALLRRRRARGHCRAQEWMRERDAIARDLEDSRLESFGEAAVRILSGSELDEVDRRLDQCGYHAGDVRAGSDRGCRGARARGPRERSGSAAPRPARRRRAAGLRSPARGRKRGSHPRSHRCAGGSGEGTRFRCGSGGARGERPG